jgi:26S proteasome non-ATPase regulatory subunit 10
MAPALDLVPDTPNNYKQRWMPKLKRPSLPFTRHAVMDKVCWSDTGGLLNKSANSLPANVVESLLNADPKLISRRDDDERLPLHWATSYNRLPIVELLVERKDCDIDAKDGAGWTSLMMAASLKESDALVDLLLAKGADVDEKTNNGQTALHFTASKSNLDTAKKLIAHKASARVKDKRGQLPLHRAAAVGNVPIMKLMLENKSPVNATDMDGYTALHHAIAEGNGDAAVVLLKAGAETDKKNRDDKLAIELAPDAKVRDYVMKYADEEGINMRPS